MQTAATAASESEAEAPPSEAAAVHTELSDATPAQCPFLPGQATN
jgi:hypothetical protein